MQESETTGVNSVESAVREVLAAVLAVKHGRDPAAVDIRFSFDDSIDPLEPIRENRERVEQLATSNRDDNLDAVARYLLAVADGEQPDPDDAIDAGLPTPDQLEGGR